MWNHTHRLGFDLENLTKPALLDPSPLSILIQFLPTTTSAFLSFLDYSGQAPTPGPLLVSAWNGPTLLH